MNREMGLGFHDLHHSFPVPKEKINKRKRTVSVNVKHHERRRTSTWKWFLPTRPRGSRADQAGQLTRALSDLVTDRTVTQTRPGSFHHCWGKTEEENALENVYMKNT